MIEPLIGATIDPTPPLAAILGRHPEKTPMVPELDALKRELSGARKLAAA